MDGRRRTSRDMSAIQSPQSSFEEWVELGIICNVWLQRGGLCGKLDIESRGSDSIQDLIEASNKQTEISDGLGGNNANKYFEIVSPLLWKRSPTFLFDKFVTMVYRNIATCSDRSTCQVWLALVMMKSLLTKFLKTCFPIPSWSLMHLGLPLSSSLTHI